MHWLTVRVIDGLRVRDSVRLSVRVLEIDGLSVADCDGLCDPYTVNDMLPIPDGDEDSCADPDTGMLIVTSADGLSENTIDAVDKLVGEGAPDADTEADADTDADSECDPDTEIVAESDDDFRADFVASADTEFVACTDADIAEILARQDADRLTEAESEYDTVRFELYVSVGLSEAVSVSVVDPDIVCDNDEDGESDLLAVCDIVAPAEPVCDIDPEKDVDTVLDRAIVMELDPDDEGDRLRRVDTEAEAGADADDEIDDRLDADGAPLLVCDRRGERDEMGETESVGLAVIGVDADTVLVATADMVPIDTVAVLLR